MKVELNIIPENAIELLHIVAKLRDLDSSQKDSVPFMPDDPRLMIPLRHCRNPKRRNAPRQWTK